MHGAIADEPESVKICRGQSRAGQPVRGSQCGAASAGQPVRGSQCGAPSAGHPVPEYDSHPWSSPLRGSLRL